MTDDFDSEEELFEQLDADVGEREGDPFEDVNGLFDEEEIPEMDPDTVWEDVQSEPLDGAVDDSEAEPVLSSNENDESLQEATDATVSTHSYCEQCEFFSAPPAIDCRHPGTEVLGFPDLETVRVRNGPVVAERRELERE